MAVTSFFQTAGTSVYLAVFLVALYALFRLFRNKSSRLPTGPIGLPIVGYLPFLTKNPHLKLIELRKKYGPVFSVKMGSHDIVVLCDFKSLRDAFVQDAFMGRPSIFQFALNKETFESGAMSTVKWKDQRRFSLTLLRDLGFGKSRMEEHIQEEIRYALDYVRQQARQPIVLRKVLSPSMSNNIASLMFGRRMEYNDPKRIMLTNLIKDSTKFTAQVSIALFFPWVKTIMSWLNVGGLNQLDEANNKLKRFFSDEITEHEKSLDPDNIRDFIDGYLLQMEKKKDEPDTTFLRPVMVDLVGAFFGGGSDTVRITIDWLLLVSAAFPDVQRRVQAEIDEVVGAERFPQYVDHSKMPYTQAVIMEILRWRNIIPLNFFRCTLEDTEINSLFIPKGTCIMGNQWAVQHDPSLWGHPESFRPERFLTADGKGVEKPEYYIPFSIGRRTCPGETFANIEVFLYFTAILQKFSIRKPEGATLDMEGEFTVSLQPKQQALVFELRH